MTEFKDWLGTKTFVRFARVLCILFELKLQLIFTQQLCLTVQKSMSESNAGEPPTSDSDTEGVTVLQVTPPLQFAPIKPVQKQQDVESLDEDEDAVECFCCPLARWIKTSCTKQSSTNCLIVFGCVVSLGLVIAGLSTSFCTRIMEDSTCFLPPSSLPQSSFTVDTSYVYVLQGGNKVPLPVIPCNQTYNDFGKDSFARLDLVNDGFECKVSDGHVRLDYWCPSPLDLFFWISSVAFLLFCVSWAVAYKKSVLVAEKTIKTRCDAVSAFMTTGLLSLFMTWLYILGLILFPAVSFCMAVNAKPGNRKKWAFASALQMSIYGLISLILAMVLLTPVKISEQGFHQRGNCSLESVLLKLHARCPQPFFTYTVNGNFTTLDGSQSFNFTMQKEEVTVPLLRTFENTSAGIFSPPTVDFPGRIGSCKCFRNPNSGQVAYISPGTEPSFGMIVGDQSDILRVILGPVLTALILLFSGLAALLNPWKSPPSCQEICKCCFIRKSKRRTGNG